MKRCINAYRPQMHCEGKCQLMQKIKAGEEREKQQPPELKIAKSELIAAQSDFPHALVAISTKRKQQFVSSVNGKPIDHPTTILRPPCNA